MKTFIACERGTHLNSQELNDVIDGYKPLNVIATFNGLRDQYAPDNLGTGDWVMLSGRLYTISKKIVEPCPTHHGSNDLSFDTYYLIWPMAMDEGDAE